VKKAEATILIRDMEIVNNARIVVNKTSPTIYDQTFYARTFPNADNFFLSSNITDENGVVQGVNTRAEIAQSLYDALNTDIFFSQNYNISIDVDNVTVRIRAKQTGSKFNLNTDNVFIRDENNVDTTDYFTFTTISEGVDQFDGQTVSQYNIYAELFVNTDVELQYKLNGIDNKYERVSELIIPFNKDNNHVFNFSDILSSYVNTPQPFYGFSGFTVLPDMMRPFFLKFGELYPIVSNSNTLKKRFKQQTAKKWFINSAKSYYDDNDMQEYEGIPISYLNPEFTVSNGTSTITVNDIIDDQFSGLTTGIQYELYNNDTDTITHPFQSSNTFTGVSDAFYEIRISGVTSGITYVLKRNYLRIFSNRFFTENPPSIPIYNAKYLTNSPVNKRIQRNQNEYLYFFIKKDFGFPLSVVGDIYFYDGTSSTGQTLFNITTNTRNAGGVFVLNLSYDKLGLENYEISGSTSRKIKYIDVAVQYEYSGQTLNLTQNKRYSFEINEQERKFGVIFQNKLGGYDTFDFIGIVEETVDRSNSEYTIPQRFNASASYQQGFKAKSVYDVQAVQRITCNTGWMDAAHYEWIKELIASNNIYSYTQDNQRYLKIVDYQYTKSSQEDLFFAEFTFEYTLYDNNIKV